MTLLREPGPSVESGSSVLGWPAPAPRSASGPALRAPEPEEVEAGERGDARRSDRREERRRRNQDLVALLDQWMAEDDPEQADRDWAEVKEGLERHPVRFREKFDFGEGE